VTHSGGKPHAVGDKGQRYEVRATGYPKPGQNVIGWASDFERAVGMANAIAKAPTCTASEVFDREKNKIVAAG
jgi:hypothetical protein